MPKYLTSWGSLGKVAACGGSAVYRVKARSGEGPGEGKQEARGRGALFKINSSRASCRRRLSATAPSATRMGIGMAIPRVIVTGRRQWLRPVLPTQSRGNAVEADALHLKLRARLGDRFLFLHFQLVNILSYHRIEGALRDDALRLRW